MAKKYPEFQPLFKQATKWVIKPMSDRKRVKLFLNKYTHAYFKFWKKLLKNKNIHKRSF